MSKTENLVKEHQAIPEKGQSQEDFIKEELSKEPKTTWNNYLTTVLPAMLQSKVKISLSQFKGWTDEVKITEIFENISSPPSNDEKKEVNEPDKVNKTPEVEKPSGKNTDVNIVPETSEALELEPIIDQAVEILNVKTFARFSWHKTIPFSKKENSFYRFEQVGIPEDRNSVLWIDTPKIGNFSNAKEYVIQIERLIDKIFNMMVIIMGQDESFDDKYEWEHTNWDSVGFKIPELLTKFKNPETFTKLFSPKSFPRESNTEKVFKRFFSVTDWFSRFIEKISTKYYQIDELIAETQKKIILFRDYFEHFLSNNWSYLKTIPDAYLPEYTFWDMEVPSATDFNALVLTSPTIRNYVVSFLREEVVRRVIHGQINSVSDYTSILKTMNTRLNEIRNSNTAAARITARNPESFMKTLLLACSVPKYVYINYMPRDQYSYDLVSVLDCVTLHLLVPSYCFKKKTMNRINNYLYAHVFSRIKGSKPIVNSSTLDPDRDHLEMNVSTIKPLALRTAVRRFLISSDQNGYSNAGRFVSAQVPGKFVPIMGRTVRYVLPYGDMNTDSMTYPHLDSFLEFVNALTGVQFNQAFRKSGEALINMLSRIAERSVTIARLGYSLTESIKVISASPYIAPIMAVEAETLSKIVFPKIPYLDRASIELEIGFSTAYAIFGQVTEERIAPLEFEDIFDSLYLRGWLNQVSQRYDYAKQHLVEPDFYSMKVPLFKKSERYDFAIEDGEENYHAPSQMKLGFREELSSRGLIGLKLKPQRFLTKKRQTREKIRELILSVPQMFGFVSEIALSKTVSKIKAEQDVRMYMFDPLNLKQNEVYYFDKTLIHQSKIYTYQDLMRSITSNVLQEEIMGYLKEHRPVILKLPFNIELGKYFYNPNVVPELPITFEENNRLLTLKNVKIYYDYEREYDYVRFYQPQMIKEPLVVPIYRGYIPYLPNENPQMMLLASMKMVKRPTMNVKSMLTSQLFEMMFYTI